MFIYERYHTLFLGFCTNKESFESSFEQIELSQFFNVDTGDYFASSSNLAEYFGFNQ